MQLMKFNWPSTPTVVYVYFHFLATDIVVDKTKTTVDVHRIIITAVSEGNNRILPSSLPVPIIVTTPTTTQPQHNLNTTVVGLDMKMTV